MKGFVHEKKPSFTANSFYGERVVYKCGCYGLRHKKR